MENTFQGDGSVRDSRVNSDLGENGGMYTSIDTENHAPEWLRAAIQSRERERLQLSSAREEAATIVRNHERTSDSSNISQNHNDDSAITAVSLNGEEDIQIDDQIREIEREIVRDMNYMRRANSEGEDADLRLFNERVRAYLRQRHYHFVDDNEEDDLHNSEMDAERANLRWALRMRYNGADDANDVQHGDNQRLNLVCNRSHGMYPGSHHLHAEDQSMLPGPCEINDYEGWMKEDCQRLIPLSAMASTTDHVSQCASNVLRNDENFWSSTGSADGMREESLLIKLINPLNRIRAVQVHNILQVISIFYNTESTHFTFH